MDLQKFKEQYFRKKNSKKPPMTKDEHVAAHSKLISNAKSYNDLFIIHIEEMAELTQHLSKIIRNKEKADKDNLGAIEELADVQICLEEIRIMFGISEEDLRYAMDVKMERNLKRIEK